MNQTNNDAVKRPDTKGGILQDFFFMRYKNRRNQSTKLKVRLMVIFKECKVRRGVRVCFLVAGNVIEGPGWPFYEYTHLFKMCALYCVFHLNKNFKQRNKSIKIFHCAPWWHKSCLIYISHFPGPNTVPAQFVEFN